MYEINQSFASFYYSIEESYFAAVCNTFVSTPKTSHPVGHCKGAGTSGWAVPSAG
jgi:hypothetical protein